MDKIKRFNTWLSKLAPTVSHVTTPC